VGSSIAKGTKMEAPKAPRSSAEGTRFEVFVHCYIPVIMLLLCMIKMWLSLHLSGAVKISRS